jgi:hypothetical protein
MTITTVTFNSVNVGAAPNDGTGDDLRDAFIKVNSNFSNISTIGFNAANIYAPIGTVQAKYFIGDGSQLTNVNIKGNISPGGTGNVYAIGYLNVPQNNQSTNSYVLTLNDLGGHILTTVSSSANIFIPNNSSVNWPIGTAIGIVNNGTGNASITANSGVTLYLAGNVTTGSNLRVLGTRGMATLLNIAANVWYVNGTSLT